MEKYSKAVVGEDRPRRQNTLPNRKVPDAIDFERGIVRELKPNNSRKIREGTKQVKEYRELLQFLYPNKNWKFAVDTYKENADGSFSYQYGKLQK